VPVYLFARRRTGHGVALAAVAALLLSWPFQARIGTPRVTSWKSQFTIAWKGQESSRAATAARATPCPVRRRANRYTGTADAARASAMTTPSMRGSGHTQ